MEFIVIAIVVIAGFFIWRSATSAKLKPNTPNEEFFVQALHNLETGNLEGWRSDLTKILDRYNIVLGADSELNPESISALNQDLIEFDENKKKKNSKVSLQTTVISEIMQEAETTQTKIDEDKFRRMFNPSPQDVIDALLGDSEGGFSSEDGIIHLFSGYVVSDDFVDNMSFKGSLFDEAEDNVNTDDPALLEEYIRKFAHDYQRQELKAVSKLADLLQRGIVGKLDLNGKFIEDYDAAIDNLNIAASAGNSQSQYSLGIMFLNGEHMPVDYIKAEKWLSEAVSQEEYGAFEPLIKIYEEGKGVNNSSDRIEKLKAEFFALHDKMFSNI